MGIALLFGKIWGYLEYDIFDASSHGGKWSFLLAGAIVPLQ